MDPGTKQIADMLEDVKAAVEENRFSDAAVTVQNEVSQHPEWIDDRLQAEIGLIEKQIEYKTVLHDWEYFRVMKLVYRYCEQLYATEEICRPDDFELDRELPDKDVIWWCWLQGLEQAPEIVRACYHSLKKMGRRIVVLTEENLAEYVRLPEWIMEAKTQGRIDNTRYSDLIRIELLTTRGGTWIDATVFCSDSAVISDTLAHASLFAYSFLMRDSVSDCMMFDNWFLHCSKPSRILTETKRMLWAYWRNETGLRHYFLFHLLFSIACRRNPEELAQIPLYSNEPVHMLQLEMLKPYEEHRWQQICGMSGIHKLTYKYDREQNLDGTMLEHILKCGM